MFSHSRLKVLTVVLALLIFVQPVVKANVLCDTLKSVALTACSTTLNLALDVASLAEATAIGVEDYYWSNLTAAEQNATGAEDQHLDTLLPINGAMQAALDTMEVSFLLCVIAAGSLC